MYFLMKDAFFKKFEMVMTLELSRVGRSTKNLLEIVEKLKEKGNPLVFVGDVVGTGSSRKSATNSVLWHMGDEIPYIPNKKEGGFCFGGKIAPIFFNTLEDSGAFPIELDVSKMEMGQDGQSKRLFKS